MFWLEATFAAKSVNFLPWHAPAEVGSVAYWHGLEKNLVDAQAFDALAQPGAGTLFFGGHGRVKNCQKEVNFHL